MRSLAEFTMQIKVCSPALTMIIYN